MCKAGYPFSRPGFHGRERGREAVCLIISRTEGGIEERSPHASKLGEKRKKKEEKFSMAKA